MNKKQTNELNERVSKLRPEESKTYEAPTIHSRHRPLYRLRRAIKAFFETLLVQETDDGTVVGYRRGSGHKYITPVFNNVGSSFHRYTFPHKLKYRFKKAHYEMTRPLLVVEESPKEFQEILNKRLDRSTPQTRWKGDY